VITAFATLALAAMSFPPAPADTVRLHRYSATEASFDVNAYWLESDAGIVLIDALFLGSDAKLLGEMIWSTKKPLKGIILTHPHVDHYGGVAQFRKEFPEAPVFATPATAAGIQGTHDRGVANEWLKAFIGDYGGPIRPDSLVPSGTTLTLAGMHFRLEDLGAGEAENNTIIHNRELNVLFTGDATVAHAPIYFGEGRVAGIAEGLRTMAAKYPDSMMIYSGHYAPMPLKVLVDANLAQIAAARAVVSRAARDTTSFGSDRRLRADVRSRLLAELTALYRPLATYGYTPTLLAEFNLPALVADARRPE
jgi:glyoxylase-like metal-dependent hydrolase (beta-lactamase superfamily II)